MFSISGRENQSDPGSFRETMKKLLPAPPAAAPSTPPSQPPPLLLLLCSSSLFPLLSAHLVDRCGRAAESEQHLESVWKQQRGEKIKHSRGFWEVKSGSFQQHH